MKKTFQFGLLLMFVLVAFTNRLLAQIDQKEALALTKKYEQAYNKKDDKALKAMYTKDATKTNPDGTVLTGSEAIRASLVQEFEAVDSETLAVTYDSSTTVADGTITSTGSYRATGKAKTGEAFDVKGTYTNTLVKEKGQWKILKKCTYSIVKKAF